MRESNEKLVAGYDGEESNALAAQQELRRQVLEMLDRYGVSPGALIVKRRANMNWNRYVGDILTIEVQSKECSQGGSLEGWPFGGRS